MENHVRIFDTTLRDGEQSPGATMNIEEKLVIARQLERLGVDIIEAGFAASSEGDFEAVQRVAGAVTKPVVLSLARTREQDIDRALRAAGAAHLRLHTDTDWLLDVVRFVAAQRHARTRGTTR